MTEILCEKADWLTDSHIKCESYPRKLCITTGIGVFYGTMRNLRLQSLWAAPLNFPYSFALPNLLRSSILFLFARIGFVNILLIRFTSLSILFTNSSVALGPR
uniref:Uncharacterized protein n=1 Tax=Rhizophagus irregularis (strain DAOM 181602 / DAOM 197198 / MUCL 43194) TaxID=747089 RepID=U9ULK3_RHIID